MVEDLAVKGHRRGASRVQPHRGLRAEVGHESRQLRVRHPGAPRHAAVHGDHEDAAVRELADRSPRVPRKELRGEECLAGLEDRRAAGDEPRAATDRVLHVRPPRCEADVQLDPVAELGVLEKDLAQVARCLQHRASRRDLVMGAPGAQDDPPDEILVRADRRHMREDDLARAADARRPRPPGRRVEDDAAVLLERMVELAQGSELVRSELPRAGVADEAGAEEPVHPDAEARAVGQGPRREKIPAKEDAARAPALPVEEIPVDPREGRAARQPTLHRRHGLAAGDEPVGEHGLQVVETARLRRLEHVHDDALPTDRAYLALVDDSRRELNGRCRRWKRGRRDDREKDSFPQHPFQQRNKVRPRLQGLLTSS